MKIATSYTRGDSRKIAYLEQGLPQVGKIGDLVQSFRLNDLIIVNDSATAPMSVAATDRHGRRLELRLLKADAGSNAFLAIAFEGGSWKIPTELRKHADPETFGGSLIVGSQEFKVHPMNGFTCRLTASNRQQDFLRHLYGTGKMIQYSYMEHETPLWALQTIFASRPWSSEAPSSAFAFNWDMIFALIGKGVRFTNITHAAGLSSVGNIEQDRMLPLPEVSQVRSETLQLINETREKGGRVIAVGTSVVRAVEAAVRLHQKALHTDLPFENSLRISSAYLIESFDGILTGLHQEGESHFELLNAFTSARKIEEMLEEAGRLDCLTHEFGDFMLLMKD